MKQKASKNVILVLLAFLIVLSVASCSSTKRFCGCPEHKGMIG